MKKYHVKYVILPVVLKTKKQKYFAKLKKNNVCKFGYLFQTEDLYFRKPVPKKLLYNFMSGVCLLAVFFL